MATDIENADRKMQNYEKSTKKAHASNQALISSFGGLKLVLIGLALAPIADGLVQLSGALVAVAASAAQAAIALGGAFAAGVAQAVPAIGLLTAAFKQLTDIIQLVNQRTKILQDAQLNAAQRSLTHSQQLIAEARAHLAVADAQKQLIIARRDALRQIQDLNLAEKEAFLNSQRATLGLIASRNALASLEATGGSALDIASAQASVSDSQLAVRGSKTAQSRAVADAARARSLGVGGNRSVVLAQRAVTQGQQDLVIQQREFAIANANSIAGLRELEAALKRLTPAQRGLFDAIVALRKEYLKDWKGITDPIINAFTHFVKQLTDLMKDPQIHAAAVGLATAVGKGVTTVLSAFTSKQGRKEFLDILKAAKDNIPLVAGIIRDMLQLFTKIAIASAPLFHTILTGIKGFFDGFNANKQKSVNDFFTAAGKTFLLWVNVGKGIVGIFSALVSNGGLKTGNNLVKNLGDFLNHVATELGNNKKGVGEFFDRVGTVMGSVGKLIRDIAQGLLDISKTGGFEGLVKVLDNVVLPVLKLVLIAMGDIFALLGKISDHNAGLLQVAAGFIGVLVVTNKVIKGIEGIKPALDKAGAAVDWFKKKFITAQAEQATATEAATAAETTATEEAAVAQDAAFAATPWGLVILGILAIVAAIVLLDKKFHFLGPTFKWLKDAFFAVIDYVKQNWKGLLAILLVPFGPLGLAIYEIITHFKKVKEALAPILSFILDHIIKPLYNDGVKPILDTLNDIVHFLNNGGLDTAFSSVFNAVVGVAKTALGIIESIYHTIKSIVDVTKNVFFGGQNTNAGKGAHNVGVGGGTGRNFSGTGGGSSSGGVSVNLGGSGGGTGVITAGGTPGSAGVSTGGRLLPRTNTMATKPSSTTLSRDTGSNLPHQAGFHATRKVAQEYAISQLKKFGWSASQAGSLIQLWMGESGWQWGVPNHQGSGAYGIPQALPADKMASAGPDYIDNAFTQIDWGMNYIKQRYGSPSGALSFWNAQKPHWYAMGGEVPGTGTGDTVPAMLTPGEIVLNAAHQKMLGGKDVLKKYLGLATNSGPFFASGAFVARPIARPTTSSVSSQNSGRSVPSILADFVANANTTIWDVVDQANAAFKAIKATHRGWNALTNAISQFDVVLGTMQSNATATLAIFKNRQISSRFRVSGASGNTSVVDTLGGAPGSAGVRTAQDTLSALGVQRDGLLAQQQANQQAQAETQRLANRTVNPKQKAALLGIVAKYQQQALDLTSALAQNTTDLVGAQAAFIQAQVDKINTTATTTINTSALAQHIAEATGIGRGNIPAYIQGQIDGLQAQKAGLQAVLAQAAATGNTDLYNQILAQMQQIDGTIVDDTIAKAQSVIDAVNLAFSRQFTTNDLSGRIAALGGNAFNSLQAQQPVLQNRGDIIRSQISSLQNTNFGALTPLQQQAVNDQIAELTTQLAENSDAIKQNTANIKSALVDRINSTGQFNSGINSGIGGIIQSLATQSGAFNFPNYIQNLNSQQNNLNTTGAGLRGQLLSQFGINLSGDPTQQLNQLQGTDFGAIRAGLLNDTDRNTFDNLINSIIANTQSSVDNTTEIKRANGQLLTQDWSSSSWTQFRQALFDGNSNLLSAIPQAASGAQIQAGGLLRVHAGETVVPATVTPFMGAGPVNIPIHIDNRGEGDVDTLALSKRLAFEMKSKSR